MSRRPSLCRRIRVLRHNKNGRRASSPTAVCRTQELPSEPIRLSGRTLKDYYPADKNASSILGRPRIPPPGFFRGLNHEVHYLRFRVAPVHDRQKHKRPPMLTDMLDALYPHKLHGVYVPVWQLNHIAQGSTPADPGYTAPAWLQSTARSSSAASPSATGSSARPGSPDRDWHSPGPRASGSCYSSTTHPHSPSGQYPQPWQIVSSTRPHPIQASLSRCAMGREK